MCCAYPNRGSSCRCHICVQGYRIQIRAYGDGDTLWRRSLAYALSILPLNGTTSVRYAKSGMYIGALFAELNSQPVLLGFAKWHAESAGT